MRILAARKKWTWPKPETAGPTVEAPAPEWLGAALQEFVFLRTNGTLSAGLAADCCANSVGVLELQH